MSEPVLTVIRPGLGAAFQDQGRHGWRRFGVPTGGAMDCHAASTANRLLNNPPWAAVVELMLQGARFAVNRDIWVALTGADQGANIPRWRVVGLAAGDVIEMTGARSGVWAYLAIEGGFAAPLWLDSASTLAAAGLGQPLTKGQALFRNESEPRFALPPGVAGRLAPPREQRDYASPPPLRIWRGPQRDWFTDSARKAFFSDRWTLASQCSRVGYRLHGRRLAVPARSMISEPVRVGSVQVPPDGQPVVIMRDGPTIGGYPKIGMIDADDLDWLAQCRPGQSVAFVAVDE